MLWNVLEYMIWATLVAASIITVALTLDALALRGRLSRAARGAGSLLVCAERVVRGDGEVSLSKDELNELRLVRHPLAEFYSWAIAPGRRGDPELKAVGLLEKTERGRIRVAQFFARLSPLLGLGGTVLGIIQQFASTGGAGPQAMTLDAFGLALYTTLAGIGVAAIGLLTSALFLEPVVRRVQLDLNDAVLGVQAGSGPPLPVRSEEE